MAVRVLNLAGRVVRTLPESAGARGVNTLSWDGRSDQGSALPGGLYLVRIVAHDASGQQASAVATCNLVR